MACALVVQEDVWLRRISHNLRITNNDVGPTLIYCDSQAAIAYTKDLKYQNRTKHTDTKHNLYETYIEKEATLQYISMHLTKLIPRDVFVTHVKFLELHRILYIPCKILNVHQLTNILYSFFIIITYEQFACSHRMYVEQIRIGSLRRAIALDILICVEMR